MSTWFFKKSTSSWKVVKLEALEVSPGPSFFDEQATQRKMRVNTPIDGKMFIVMYLVNYKMKSQISTAAIRSAAVTVSFLAGGSGCDLFGISHPQAINDHFEMERSPGTTSIQ